MLASLTLLSLLLTAQASEAPRPPPLPAVEKCDMFDGVAAGNDPSVQLSLRLCVDAEGKLTGEAQWSSTTSGWNRRELAGTREGRSTFILHDVRMTESRPQPGWHFCTIERWTLVRIGNDLTGKYSSEKCRDEATVALSLRPAE